MLENLAHKFYVYMLLRPWNGVPCYVGKGKGRRVYEHATMGNSHYNRHLANVIKKAGGTLPFMILFSTNDETEAFAWETKFILTIGRADLKLGPLCNKTNGGEGSSGAVPSLETRAKMRVSNTGKIRSAEAIEKNRNARIGKKHSIETIQKIAIGTTGLRRTEESKARMRGRKDSLETIAKRVAARARNRELKFKISSEGKPG